MYCTNCGKEVANGVKFCSNCGTKQVGTADSIQTNNELPAAAPQASHPTPMPIIKPPAVYAGFWKRVGAYLIDSVVIGVVAFLLALWYSSVYPVEGPDAKGRTQGIGMLIGLGVTWLYFSLMELHATVGKMVFDLRVATLYGEPLSQDGVLCVWRGFVKSFLVPLTISIGFLISLFTPRKQALHDILAGTVVVNASATPKEISASEPRNSLMTNKVAVALSLVIAIIPILAAIALPAYQDYTTRARLAGSNPFNKFDPKPAPTTAEDFLNEGASKGSSVDQFGGALVEDTKPQPGSSWDDVGKPLNAQGTYTWPDGMKYVGEWKDGKLNGQGTQTLPDGGKYVGRFKDNNRHGQGTYTWPNRQKYVGEFKDGYRHGRGTTYNADGTILQSGSYENDVLVRGR